MSRALRVALTVLVISAAAAVSGCRGWFLDPAAPANKAITTANTHLQKAAAADALVKQLGEELNAIPYTSDGAAQGLALTVRLKDALAEEKTELLAAKAPLDELTTLDVKPEFKQYARLEARSIETRIRITDEGTALYTEMDKLYSALRSGKTQGADSEKVIEEIGVIQERITVLSQEAAEQAQEASDYFTSKKLGG